MSDDGYVAARDDGRELDTALRYDYFTSLRYARYVRNRLRLDTHRERLSILDAGCQLGVLGQILDSGRNYSYTGLDIDVEVLRTARSTLPKAVFLLGDIDEPFVDYSGMYDIVVCSLVLGLLKNPAKGCRNLLDAASSGGEVLIIDMLRDSQDAKPTGYSAESYVRSQIDVSLSWSEVEVLAENMRAYDRSRRVSLRRIFDNGAVVGYEEKGSELEKRSGLWVFEIYVGPKKSGCVSELDDV